MLQFLLVSPIFLCGYFFKLEAIFVISVSLNIKEIIPFFELSYPYLNPRSMKVPFPANPFFGIGYLILKTGSDKSIIGYMTINHFIRC